MLLRDVEVDGRRLDVRLTGDTVAELGRLSAGPAEVVADGAGAALIPGLHDHHLHLLATAAAAESTDVGPTSVTDPASLAAALATAAPHRGWVRATGYDEAAAGDVDRLTLDRCRADVPVRVQHRSGALWIVNSAAADALGLDTATHPGIERDDDGRPTGRLWRMDDWLGPRWLSPRWLGDGGEIPALGSLGRQLAGYGVTGVTDATPQLDGATADLLAGAHRIGVLPQRLHLLSAELDRVPDGLTLGPAKLVVADHALPDLDELAQCIGDMHDRGRAVAVHCVTRQALWLTLAALELAGPRPADRIEHAAVAPPEAAEVMARLGVTVVTQPSLVARRGHHYLDRVEAADLPHLWPWASLCAAGVAVGGSSDAPYGDPDPWTGMAAAMTRATVDGRRVGAAEAVDGPTALNGWLGTPASPGGPPRRVEVGAPADVVLLDRPLAEALRAPSAEQVVLTVIAGVAAHDPGEVLQ